ncbi:MAG: 3-phosphoglycerate dehydrogenase [Clostridia bacterium]|nr:3-phosphoglycerate dehydrogenase [Clostridia bacterium]
MALYNVLKLNKIAAVGTNRLGDNYAVSDDCAAPDAVLVRSASMHEMELPASLKAIARAGAGTNNIPIDKCTKAGIAVFNTPGANANAVKELVLAGMLISSRNVVGGIDWAKTLKGNGDQVGKMVEKGKSQFAGPEIKGKTLGVVGLGAIGALVANAAAALGMKVIGYDPFLSVAGALKLDPEVEYKATLDDIYAESDYISLHVPLNAETKGTICAESIAKMKDNVRIMNFARDGLVNSTELLEGLKSGKIAAYVTDFATDDILCEDKVIAFPHLGASTPESEDNCAVMAADEIKAYLEKGSVINSVNLPAMKLGAIKGKRVCIIHENNAAILPAVTAKFASTNAVESKTRGDVAYTVIDTDADVSDDIAAIEGVISVRVI